MKDLISRRAVIEALKIDCSWDIFDEYGNITERGQNIIETISRIPTAQSEIIKCNDCKYRGKPIAGGRCWCSIHNTFMSYCSDAERRTDEADYRKE